MSGKIKIDLEAIEAMLYYWNALKDREKISEKFILDLIEMPGLTAAYEKHFNGESVRRALSAISNRERFTPWSRKEARFWNNNLWMMEDLTYTDKMVKPIKMLNPEALAAKLPDFEGEIEVIFSPLHMEEYLISDNKLIINFFKVMPVDGVGHIVKHGSSDEANVNPGSMEILGMTEITEYIVNKITNEMLNK